MDVAAYFDLSTPPLLTGLDEVELASLAAVAQPRHYAAGSYLFRESQPRRAFGILLSGRVDIVKGMKGLPQVLHVLGVGESYGEGSLLEDYPHSTSGLAREDSETLEIPRAALTAIAEDNPRLFGKLAMFAAQVISSRLRHANARLGSRGLGYLSGELRTEHDLLGERALSVDLYYGVQTLRATENFPITGIPISQYPHLVNALAAVKEGAALATLELGLLPPEVADAIVRACGEI